MWHNEIGGGFLNIGIYPLAFAVMVFGAKPEKITSAGKLNDGGVDVYNFVTLEYTNSRFATIEYTMLATLDGTVTITGSKGRIHLLPRLIQPQKFNSEGFRYEAEAVVKAIQSKQQEIKEYSFGESLQIMTIMDKIRKDMGLVYPADNK
ncbi:unnamed protein product [Peronospora belbahrii]|uniref:GFO/IDH/MocA-like oxidoreductase domain-containing protein n=1 Tax=Peronospora belbahrii TaxID=622444 RepID=A0AAU9L3Y2_9STRA|nr:unnamed protein product [Peronospora belbahrii]